MSSEAPSYRNISNTSSGPRKIFQRRAILSIGNSPPINARTLDISTGELSAMIARPMQEGQLCTMSIGVVLDEVPCQIVVNCRIQYCILAGMKGYRIGVLFQNVDAATAEKIKKVMGPT